MSHEGIRILTGEAAAAAQQQEQRSHLTGDAIKPRKVRVDRSGGTGVEILWRDGHSSHWSFAWLRLACPCATCNEEREREHRPLGAAPPKPTSLLPLYEAPVRPLEVLSVGNYAIKFQWSDGHEAGIYSWDFLRNVADPAKLHGARQKS